MATTISPQIISVPTQSNMSLGRETSEDGRALQTDTVPARLSDTLSILDCLTQFGALPSREEVDTREAAVTLLRAVLTDDTPNADSTSVNAPRHKPALVVVPVGSYGLGAWTPASEIDCLCIGPFSERTFFALEAQRLRKASSRGIKIKRRVHAHTGTMLDLEVLGVRMSLQYCPATSIAELWPNALKAPTSDPIWSLSAQTLSKLEAARLQDNLVHTIPNLESFRLCHRFIKTWAKSRGIYSAQLGFLSDTQISVLLARVCKRVAQNNGAACTPDVLAAFFHHSTVKGSTVDTSTFAGQTIVKEFRRASALLSSAPSWISFLSGSDSEEIPDLSGGANDFLKRNKSYVKVDFAFWGISLAKGSSFVTWLEHRCVGLLVDISRRIPGLAARIWPARFIESGSVGNSVVFPGEDELNSRTQIYQGCFLIGLDKLDVDMGREQLRATLHSLKTVLRRFEGQIRGDEKYFNAHTCAMTATVVGQSHLGPLETDPRDWRPYIPGDEDEDDEWEDELDNSSAGELGDRDSLKDKHRKSNKFNTTDAVEPRLEPGKRFRPASDVMNRLRWDPELDSGDYIIGYEDRFLGPQERALDAWKMEQTDEEFIPQHRILYFKRNSDNELVWDRKTRKDIIFGSGL